jgi:hypothetical protein
VNAFLRDPRASLPPPMPDPPTIIDFVTDGELLEPFFQGPSWRLWRVILKAAFGLPLQRGERLRFREVAGGREPPTKPVRELVAVVGRGGGKDSIASALATFIACAGNFSKLRPGEKASVLCLATNRDQGQIAFSYIASYFERVPMLAAMVERIDRDTVTLRNGAQILVGTNSFRWPRGLTLCCCIYDEVGFWWSDDYANPDFEVDVAVSPALMRFPGSLKVLISSANKRSGLLYDRYSEFYGKDDPDVLVVKGTSLQFNPTLDAAIIERELQRDQERASAEYLSEWRSDLSAFLDRELIEAAIDRDVVVRPPQPGFRYLAFADPSGGRGDSFACAIAHVEINRVVLDALYERPSPFDPSTVVAEIADLLRQYGIVEVVGDRYAAQWVTESFARDGIRYTASERDKSEVFLDCLPLFTSGRARILDSARLRYQLISLERKTTRVGRDIVSHPEYRTAHDDLANAAAGALVLAASEHLVPSLWCNADLFAGNRPIPWPTRSVIVFATAATDERGVFLAYWAKGADLYASENGAILLVDYVQTPLTPSLFQEVAARLNELASMQVPHPHGRRTIPAGKVVPMLCTQELRPHAQAAGLDVNYTDGTLLLQQRDALLLACGAWISSGAVKIADLAYARSHALPIPLAEIRVDAPESAACDCVLLGLGGALPVELQPVAWKEVA